MKRNKIKEIFTEISKSINKKPTLLFETSFLLLLEFLESFIENKNELEIKKIIDSISNGKLTYDAKILEELKKELDDIKKENKWLRQTNKNLLNENKYLKECEKRLKKITDSKVYKLYSKLKKYLY